MGSMRAAAEACSVTYLGTTRAKSGLETKHRKCSPEGRLRFTAVTERQSQAKAKRHPRTEVERGRRKETDDNPCNMCIVSSSKLFRYRHEDVYVVRMYVYVDCEQDVPCQA